MFRKGNPAAVGKPAATASVRKNGGWFGGGACPDVPRDGDVITEQDLEAYTAALTRHGFFGPNAWYMNHKANGQYSRQPRRPGSSRRQIRAHCSPYLVKARTSAAFIWTMPAPNAPSTCRGTTLGG
jgi:hypothetical protein